MAFITVRTTIFGAVPTIEMIEELEKDKIIKCEIRDGKLVQEEEFAVFTKSENFNPFKHRIGEFLYKHKMCALFSWSDDDCNWLGYILLYPNQQEVEMVMPLGYNLLYRSEDEFINFMKVDIDKMMTEYEVYKKEMEEFNLRMEEKMKGEVDSGEIPF
jgi:hypothetical protein